MKSWSCFYAVPLTLITDMFNVKRDQSHAASGKTASRTYMYATKPDEYQGHEENNPPGRL